MKPPLCPWIRIGIAKSIACESIDSAFSVPNPSKTIDPPARAPGVFAEPGAERIVIANDQKKVATPKGIFRSGAAVIHAGMNGAEIVIDIDPGDQRADSVQPVLGVRNRNHAEARPTNGASI